MHTVLAEEPENLSLSIQSAALLPYWSYRNGKVNNSSINTKQLRRLIQFEVWSLGRFSKVRGWDSRSATHSNLLGFCTNWYTLYGSDRALPNWFCSVSSWMYGSFLRAVRNLVFHVGQSGWSTPSVKRPVCIAHSWNNENYTRWEPVVITTIFIYVLLLLLLCVFRRDS